MGDKEKIEYIAWARHLTGLVERQEAERKGREAEEERSSE